MVQNTLFSRRGVILSAGACALAPIAAYADQPAETFISGVLTEANAFIGGNEQARLDGIARLVDKYVDMRRISRFALGQYARQITDAQRAEYEPLFRRYAKLVYQQALTTYSGQPLEVTGSIDRSARDIIVRSKVIAAAGSEFANLEVLWRVYRARDGAMSVIDAGANGIWLAIEQQSQFKSIIANNGGGTTGIDALIREIKAQLDR
ncbi:MAG: ABC transporter substrate-binding protein [Pseudomonadota bacterium]